ncbi:FMN-binding negative transcriptional regulator [Mycobacterium intracellulare]|uniref:FMN-binding negative transcriptional regulator n=1 Tax=Mycobacterium intracellulare TaxID=1767 RepID=UPI001EEE1EA9|nr:FMN-binding negative transcriptional regulator [Mycobacterium intracellulare]MEE3755322.1 FMN-binding negative transcriptional regulator [Mycobacterium intracellulare]
MYIPTHFAADEQAVDDLLAHPSAADLITATPEGLLATTLPFIYDRDARTLRGHVARNNDQWQRPVIGEALVIVRGPDAYISPAWYPSKAEHGRVVPTWNYVTAHVYGQLVVHDDPAWVEQNVRELTERHEAGRLQPWSVDDAPPQFIEGLLRAIVGLELLITRIEAKFKLSQNRPAADIDGVISGLIAEGRQDAAQAMQHPPTA